MLNGVVERYHGRNLCDMTKEELIEVIQKMHEWYSESHERHMHHMKVLGGYKHIEWED